jgi:hypothetical protein
MATLTRTQVFDAVHAVGGLLPADMLLRISVGKEVNGCRPADYGVVGTRSVRDDAERHWDYLRSVWSELRDRLPAAPEADTPADPTGVAVTQWLEPLFAELGFGRLTATGAAGIRSDDDGRTFPISHRWRHVPIHLAPWNAGLDQRPGGAGTVPPQSLLQECLNRTDANLWGVLTNGRQLRLLRDSSALATASYVEFDLEAIFDGELFSEFLLVYRLLHVSRFEVDEGTPPSGCWLEKWRVEAIASGTRALEHHRDGVQAAITALGTGFLKHPANSQLRENLDTDAFHAALLRLVYRLIFLFVAEDRGALHPDTAPEPARQRYAAYFSSRRLRRQAIRRRGTAHGDLYQALRFVLDALGDEHGRPELGLPALGGLFDQTDADAPLRGLSVSNLYLLEAVRHLARVRDAGSSRWRQVDYRNIGSEELGSIYESLLDLVPVHSAVDRSFELVNRLGNDRKKTGSYYTPTSLIEVLLNSTLDPVIDDAQKRGEEKASAAGQPDPIETVVTELLSLTVCDPACGSGHFLVAAARRIAKRIAAVREKNPEPTLDAVRHALHEVVARCVYGVDLNPMAVELAKVSLWLEALEPGRPLSFLDARIKHGNALIGATPALLREGIPSKAFKPVEGDDDKFARVLEKRNDEERAGQAGLFDLDTDVKVANTAFAASLRRIAAAPAETLRDVHRQAAAYRDWEAADEYVHAKHVADAWCAAFMWHKTADAPPAITDEVFRALQDPDAAAASQVTHDEIVRLRQRYRFFHWHLEFPEIVTVPADGAAGVDSDTGWAGGFSCVLGNPPWDKVDFEDKKYFSVVDRAIAAISGTARRTRIAQWAEENPTAGERYRAERRKVKSTFLFAGSSGAFPLCGKGLTVKGVNSLQTDQLFGERFASIVAPKGRFGCIIPTAIATGAGAQHLFSSLAQRGAVRHLYDLENRKLIFQGVDATYKFCLLSLVGRELREPVAEFAFFLLDIADLDDASNTYALSAEEIALINPNTGTLPVFRTRRDADLTAAIYRLIPVLWNERRLDGNPWAITFKNHFNMTDDSDLFRTRDQLEADGWELHGNVFSRGQTRMLPLYEGKMAYLFDHRWNHFTGTGNEERRFLSLDEKADPDVMSMPRYWVVEEGLIETVRRNEPTKVPGVAVRLENLSWERDWLCGWRDVTKTVNERTAIPAFLPRVAVGHKFPLMILRVSPGLAATLIATQSSLVFDYVSRQKIGNTSMGLFVWKQLPVPSPETMEPHMPFIVPRVLELVYTAYDMTGLARDLGDEGAPFRWDEERRAQIRAELDAYFFHLYGIARDDVDYIMETFRTENGGLKHNDIAKYGRYRTKDMVLAEYDRMAPSGVDLDTPLADGANFTSLLSPLPGRGPRHPAAPGQRAIRTGEEED